MSGEIYRGGTVPTQAHTLEMFCPLLLILFLVETNNASFQPESASRFPCVGPKLWLALRQAKRSEESRPRKLFHRDKGCKLAVRGTNAKADDLDKISSHNSNQLGREADRLEHQLQKVAGEGEEHHLAQIIKTLQHTLQAKQMIEPKPEKHLRIMKVCNWYMCY